MDYSPADEPRLRTAPDGSHYASDGSHLRLTKRDPLHLSNTYLLFNRAVGGDDVSHEAFLRRGTAFHEAGHLWACHHLGVRIEPTRLSEPSRRIRARSAEDVVFIQALGPLAQGAAVEVDLCEFLDLDVTFGEGFGALMLATPTAAELSTPLPQQQRRSYTYRMHALEWLDAACLRGGDNAARGRIEDNDWLDAVLPELLSQWWGVDRLARRLLAGTLVTAPEVRDLLTEAGRR